jgi:hypothetical protein
MMAMTVETALIQLKACRDDFKALVRDRRTQAQADLAEATRMATTIREADTEAVTCLQAVIADAGTPAALKTRLQQELALHARIKAEQAAEA